MKVVVVIALFIALYVLVVVGYNKGGDGRVIPALTAGGSCINRCGSSDVTTGCSCSAACTAHHTCCGDHASVCSSCVNRCTEAHIKGSLCQCDSQCNTRGGCCHDYNQTCKAAAVAGDVPDEELLLISEQLFQLDSNNVASLVQINIQNETTIDDTLDRAPLPLFKRLDEEVFKRNTFLLFEALTDNYHYQTGIPENTTDTELFEVAEFLDAVANTTIMRRLEDFLTQKRLLNGSLKHELKSMWFTEYSRSGHSVDSSGFEHTFIGDVREGVVGGFHNWIAMYREERKGALDFMGHIEYQDLQGAGCILTSRFTWHNISKPIGGGFIGTSPEFDLAMFTLCFMVRPDSLCTVQANGEPYFIQTYGYSGVNSAAKTIGTAYPIVRQQ